MTTSKSRQGVRDGRSLACTINTAPTSTMRTIGLTALQAERIIRVRRVLPLVDDRRAPCIDARKLWERIGRPHKRFRDWAEDYIKPLMERAGTFAEISAKLVQPRVGRPSKEYTLSRNVAAHLAMMANTAEGEDIRTYFLDMEDLATRLAAHLGVRVTAIVETDREVTHMFRQRAGEDAKAGRIARSLVLAKAMEREKLLKDAVCMVLTGRPTSWWKEKFRRGVRDVLDTADAALYAKCYESARAFVEAKVVKGRADLVKLLTPVYGGRVSLEAYGAKAL